MGLESTIDGALPGLPAGGPHYPPAGLEGLPARRADELFERRTADGRTLVTVADLVLMFSQRYGWPAIPAAVHVLRELSACEGLPLFLLEPGNFAREVNADDVWRERCPSGAEHEADWRDNLERRLLSFPNAISAAEAAARGITQSAHPQTGLVHVEWHKLPELYQLRGPAGALEWLRFCWVECARPLALGDGPALRLAMLLADAVRLFDEAKKSAAPSVETDQGAGRAAPAWQSDPRYIAVSKLRTLKAANQARVRETIAAEFGVDVRTVGKWNTWVEMREAEDRRQRAQEIQIQALRAA